MNTPPLLPPSLAQPTTVPRSPVPAAPAQGLPPQYAGVFDPPQIAWRAPGDHAEGPATQLLLQALQHQAACWSRRGPAGMRRHPRAGELARAQRRAGANGLEPDQNELGLPAFASPGVPGDVAQEPPKQAATPRQLRAARIHQELLAMLSQVEAAVRLASLAGAPPALRLRLLDEALRRLLPLASLGVAEGLRQAWLVDGLLARLHHLYRSHARGVHTTLRQVAELLQEAFVHAPAAPAGATGLRSWFALLPLLCLWVRDTGVVHDGAWPGDQP